MPLGLLLFALVLLVLVNWALPPLSPEKKRRLKRYTLWIALAVVLLGLLRLGLPWLALLGAGAAAALRWVAPIIVRLAPLWLMQRSASRRPGAQPGPGRAEQPDPRRMTRAQALEILNLREDASREEIISAYRELIRRVHPDRGGSSYLAAEVNRAKDVLLSQEHS